MKVPKCLTLGSSSLDTTRHDSRTVLIESCLPSAGADSTVNPPHTLSLYTTTRHYFPEMSVRQTNTQLQTRLREGVMYSNNYYQVTFEFLWSNLKIQILKNFYCLYMQHIIIHNIIMHIQSGENEAILQLEMFCLTCTVVLSPCRHHPFTGVQVWE